MCTGVVKKTAVLQIFHPKHKLLTSENISHIMYSYCFLSFLYMYLVQGIINLSILVWEKEHSHEIKIARKMSTIPLVPKLKTAEKSTHLEREQETEATKEHPVCYVSRKCNIGIK